MASLRSARELLELEPRSPARATRSPRSRCAKAILLALGRGAEAERALLEAIALLEPLAEGSVPGGRQKHPGPRLPAAGPPLRGGPLLRGLLEKGWRRPDLLRLAASQGALPGPLPPPLELDFSLPPGIRAYLDSLPPEPPPWETATDLPAIEDILAAEEARIVTAMKGP